MKKIIRKQTFNLPVADLWKKWSSKEGLNKFFGVDSKMELKIGGPFEIYFTDQVPEGSRGSEECKVLSYLPNEMLSFSWNAPPSIPSIRALGPSSWVVLQFASIASNKTQLTLTHLGFQEGEDWDKKYDYFDQAWTYVFQNLEKSISSK